jgi:hypothetical protein
MWLELPNWEDPVDIVTPALSCSPVMLEADEANSSVLPIVEITPPWSPMPENIRTLPATGPSPPFSKILPPSLFKPLVNPAFNKMLPVDIEVDEPVSKWILPEL